MIECFWQFGGGASKKHPMFSQAIRWFLPLSQHIVDLLIKMSKYFVYLFVLSVGAHVAITHVEIRVCSRPHLGSVDQT